MRGPTVRSLHNSAVDNARVAVECPHVLCSALGPEDRGRMECDRAPTVSHTSFDSAPLILTLLYFLLGSRHPFYLFLHLFHLKGTLSYPIYFHSLPYPVTPHETAPVTDHCVNLLVSEW